jgi:cyclic pyranopterin phosphate synthase
MTTNGTQLARYATQLREAGMKRINVSLDSRREDRFRHITAAGTSAG